MRVSQAGLALIQRAGTDGKVEYLTQWNEGWQAYSLIGGHVEPDETFRDCCVREVAEELDLVPEVDFHVAAQPLAPQPPGAHCEYTAMSGGTGVLTRYEVDLYLTEIAFAAALAKVDANPHNRWVTPAEIARGRLADGRMVSEQVATVFEICRVFFRTGVKPRLRQNG